MINGRIYYITGVASIDDPLIEDSPGHWIPHPDAHIYYDSFDIEYDPPNTWEVKSAWLADDGSERTATTVSWYKFVLPSSSSSSFSSSSFSSSSNSLSSSSSSSSSSNSNSSSSSSSSCSPVPIKIGDGFVIGDGWNIGDNTCYMV